MSVERTPSNSKWDSSHTRYNVEIQSSSPARRQMYSVDIHAAHQQPSPFTHTYHTPSSSAGGPHGFPNSSLTMSPDARGNGKLDHNVKNHQPHSSSSVGHYPPPLSRRVTSPELKLKSTHPPSPSYTSPSHPHWSRADDETRQSTPRHRHFRSEGSGFRESSEVRKPGGRGAPVTDSSTVYLQNGSLRRAQTIGSPKHVSDLAHSQTVHHARTVFGRNEGLDDTPTNSQMSQSSYGVGGGDDPQNQWYAVSDFNAEYPHGVLRETSSAHSSQSDSTYISGVSEPTYNRARPSTRPSAGRDHKKITHQDSRQAMAPNQVSMVNRGEAWQLEGDSDGYMDFSQRPVHPTTLEYIDQALLPPQKPYFPASPYHSSQPSSSLPSSKDYIGEQGILGSSSLRKRHSYAEPRTFRSNSNSSSRRLSQDFSAGDPFSPTQTILERRPSVDSSRSSGSRRSSVSSPPKRTSSLQVRSSARDHDAVETSRNVDGSRRILSNIDKEVVSPEHMTGHMTGHMTSPRHADSESSLNKVKIKRRHPYDHVRVAHPYECVHHTTTPTQQSATPTQQSVTPTDPVPMQMSQYDTAEVCKGSPNIQRWRISPTKRDKPVRKRFVSDSSIHHSSSKKKDYKNSPAPGKRFSANIILDNSTEDKEALKMKKLSVDEQLQAQMLNRYFPNGLTRRESSGSLEQSPSDTDETPPSKTTSRTKSAGTLVFRKIAKKFGKMSVKSTSGDGDEASDESGGSTSWSAKKAARRKKLRSNSVSNLECPDEHNRLTQSMEQLNAISGDTPTGGTPTTIPKLTRTSSKGKLNSRGSEPDIEGAFSNLFRSGSKKNLTSDPTEELFNLIEQGHTEAVQQLLYSTMSADLNLAETNEDELMPLDLATMLNHEEISKLLLEKGAKDSAKFCRDTSSRFSRIVTLLMEYERELDSLKHEHTQTFNNSSGLKDLERRLRRWEWKSHLLKMMKTNFEEAGVPGPPTSVRLHVTSSRSITVTFSEPAETNRAVVTRYKIEWSRSESFSPTVGEFVMTDLRSMEYVIPDLNKGDPYYVRVFAYNMKGFGSPQFADPPFAIPSSWHDKNNSQPRYEGKTNQMYTLAAELKLMLSNPLPITTTTSSSSINRSTKTSLKKGITKLFGSNIKLLKALKSGVYIASMVYSKNNKLLVSVDDYLPIIEVSDSHSSTVGADFVWLAKVACTWDNVRVMCDISGNYTSSPAVQFRNKLLHAILDLQETLGMQDLGLLHPVPYKDKHGAIVFIIVQELKEAKSLQLGSSSLKWSNLPRLRKRRAPLISGDLDSLPVPDQIIADAQDIIAYHSNSTRKLSKGLYLGYLKGRSTVASIKVMCSQEYPNVLPYMKIRDNPNISREEWEWFESLPSPPSHSPRHSTSTAHSQQSLQEILLPKIETFLHNLGISKEEISKHQLYRREAIELNEDITILLLLPSHENVCTPPGSTDHFAELSDFVALPINTFEIMQLYTYQRLFMLKYSMISARLEVELLTSQQRLREAFSKEDLKSAKELKEVLEKFQERSEQGWKQMRWIEEAVQRGRDQADDKDSVLSVTELREGVAKTKEKEEQRQQQIIASKRKEAELLSLHNTSLSSGYLRVFPSYTTGLVKGTSVKLYITHTTTTAEVIRLVVHQLEKARLERGVTGQRLTEEDLSDFYLVALSKNSEWPLDARACPLSLQSQSSMCRLEVRRRSEERHLDEQVTSV